MDTPEKESSSKARLMFKVVEVGKGRKTIETLEGFPLLLSPSVKTNITPLPSGIFFEAEVVFGDANVVLELVNVTLKPDYREATVAEAQEFLDRRLPWSTVELG